MDQDSKETTDSCNRKRGRDDSECNSPETKLIRLESVDSDDNSPDLVINHVDLDNLDGDSDHNSENHVDSFDSDNSGLNSPEAKRIQDDLLNIFYESDEPMIQGLDSVIKSFEEEILVPVAGTMPTATNAVFCGESQPELGYLLEASDDELGLPPTFSAEEEKVNAVDTDPETRYGASGFGEMLGFEDELPSYDSFAFGLRCDSGCNSYNSSYNDTGDFVAVGGLFDYSDDNYIPADISGA